MRDQELTILQERLDSVRQSIQNGVDVWRNRQRERYLKSRLREVATRDLQKIVF